MKTKNPVLINGLKRSLLAFTTLGLEANSVNPYRKLGQGGRVMIKRLGFLLALILFATAIPFLSVNGGASSGGGQRNQQRQAPAVKFHRAKIPVRNQYIVVLNDDTPAQEIETVTSELAVSHGGGVDRIYKDAIKGFVARMPESAALALSQDPRVEFVEEDGLGALASQQWVSPWGWNLGRIDQRDYPTGGLNDHLYNYSGTGAGVHVYVLDTGIRTTHQEFGGRATRDFDALGGNGDDCHGHGTHVAGIIGGSTHGVAKGVRLHGVRIGVTDAWGNIKCGGAGDAYFASSAAIAGLNWVAANRIRPAVANMSIVGNTSNSLDKAVRGCISAGVTVVVAAGNNNIDAINVSPARVEEAITVSATDNTDRRGSGGFMVGEGLLANYGKVVDLFAPGVNIESTWNTSDTATFRTSGTSMAAPHVAGVAAQFLQANPTADPDAVQGAIKSSATTFHVIDPGPDTPNRLLYSSINASLVSESTVIVPEDNWGEIDTGVDIGFGEWATISATGTIIPDPFWPILTDPEGLDLVTDSIFFPLPGARMFSLVGRIDPTENYNSSYFYIGRSNATRINLNPAKRLFLTINDDWPGTGLGAFTCRIQVWKKRPSGAIFVGQNVPTVMTPGQTITVDVSMFNSGETTWNTGSNFWLGSQNPQDNLTWGINRAPLPNPVPPGSQAYIPFTITAPTTPGTYNFRWRMVQDGVEWFGDLTDNIPITVLANSNQAQFISQSVPGLMTASEPYQVSITMKNTGNTTWQAGTAYRLGSQNPQDNTRWGTSRVVLPNSVPPGSQVTFTFTVNAPAISGTYNFQWRMLKEGVEWFGDYTTNVSVRVKPPVCPTC